MGHVPIRTVTAVAAAVVVVAVPPRPHAWAQATRSAGGPPHLDALASLLASGGLWLLAVWVLVALLAGRAAALPGAAGVVGRFLVRVCVPRVLRGVVLGGVAGGLLLGPAVAASAAPGPVWPTTPAAVAATTPTPAWPTTPPAPASTGAPATTTPAPPPTTPPATPAPATPPAAPSATPQTPAAVVVAPGDSLWSIASDALARDGATPTDAKVAAAWPAWYAVNRAAVGPDPGLLHPGTHLTAPTTDGSTS